MAAFKRPMRTPQNCCHQCLCLCSEPQPSRASVGDPPLLPGRLAQSLLSHCFFPWVLVCETLCVPSMSRVVSPSPAEFLWSNPTCLQSHVLWGLLLLSPDVQAGSLIRGSELSLLWEVLCGVITFQFVGHPPGMYEIWFYGACAPS